MVSNASKHSGNRLLSRGPLFPAFQDDTQIPLEVVEAAISVPGHPCVCFQDYTQIPLEVTEPHSGSGPCVSLFFVCTREVSNLENK